MKNEVKQAISILEARILVLETMMKEMIDGLQYSANTPTSCKQCGAVEPQRTNYVCSNVDCIQGLNPMDDER